ncbi:RNA methylase [Seminavis robusta]|uniref:RNA methylase n=1 Tax=Seminavis robusta TaxID=568900 RepID=A0A9N8ES21_9STRA|nr:RNA methylase [Seminavis robusta]|eukprot:Sro1442_g273000.1 RNA methylase (364) ;mRNA; f:1443-2644
MTIMMSRWQRSGMLSWRLLRATNSYPRHHPQVMAALGAGTGWQPPFTTATRSLSSTASSRIRRRKRAKFGTVKIEGTMPPRELPEATSSLNQPYSYGGTEGESSDEYFKKTSLSPWVPIPDPIARKLFDMSAAGPDDIHVELGCGDGRVNFFAIDHGRVKKSTGIDVDDGILERARERLAKRYPQPPLEFITADLLDYNNNQHVWDILQEATIITMYFVEDALLQIRPILEEKLAGKQCKIITCAYEMKGWNPTIIETTLGTTVYLYNWGSMEEDDSFFVADDNLLRDRPKELLEDPLEKMEKQGLDLDNIETVARTITLDRYDSQDTWSDSENEDEEEDMETENDTPPPAKKKELLVATNPS